MDRTKYLIALLLLSACGQDETKIDKDAIAKYEAEISAEDKAALNAYESHTSPYDKLPEVPAIQCGSEECKTNSLEMIKAWPKAWAGEYGAQRNVAFLLSTSNAGVASNPVQGCAWRIIIQVSGHMEFQPGDQSNYDLECGRLKSSEFDAAKQIANTIFEKTKHSKLPQISAPKQN